MEKGIRIIVEQHRQAFRLLVVRRGVGGEHLHGEGNGRRLLRVGRRLTPHLVLYQPVAHDAPAVAGNGIDHIPIEARARHFARLLRAVNIHPCALLTQLEGGREALADGTHTGRDVVAVDSGNHIGEHLRVVFVVELERGERRQICQRGACRAHGIQFALGVINHRVIVERDAKLSLRGNVPFE